LSSGATAPVRSGLPLSASNQQSIAAIVLISPRYSFETKAAKNLF
jgi:hypothetical protein